MDRAHVTRGSAGKYIHPWSFKALGEHTNGMFDFMVGSIGYCTGPPLHTHAEQADTWYVLKGVLKFQVGEEIFDLGPGDFATVPPGVPHSFDNVIEEQGPVEAINIMSPAGFDLALEAYNAQRSDLDPAEFGIAVVGRPIRETLGLG
jgi:mannose-6-phosphate isomerase-like protein (cupin superfamily)